MNFFTADLWVSPQTIQFMEMTKEFFKQQSMQFLQYDTQWFTSILDIAQIPVSRYTQSLKPGK